MGPVQQVTLGNFHDSQNQYIQLGPNVYPVSGLLISFSESRSEYKLCFHFEESGMFHMCLQEGTIATEEVLNNLSLGQVEDSMGWKFMFFVPRDVLETDKDMGLRGTLLELGPAGSEEVKISFYFGQNRVARLVFRNW